jgi:hypothetical protein
MIGEFKAQEKIWLMAKNFSANGGNTRANLNIEGVDLYGGTRHSTVRALRKHYSPEQIKEAAMSKTNKAFERYLGQAEDDDILSIYRKGAEVISIKEIDTGLIPLFEGQKNTK